MIQTFRKAWGVPELRKKIIFTIMILLIFRLGNAIPVPYVDTTLLQNYLDGMSTTVLGLYNVMSYRNIFCTRNRRGYPTKGFFPNAKPR